MIRNAVLALEDGSVYRGHAFGAVRTVVGEAVFNTSMTGYQEILTDPSYSRQIVTMTVPQIGNYGVNEEDLESSGPKAYGFVVRELSPIVSNWRATTDLSSYLKKHGIPGIEGVDTRAITKRLRSAGVMKACISTEAITDEEAVKRAREWKGFEGVDFVKEVTCAKAHAFKESDAVCAPFAVPGTHLNRVKKDRKVYKLAAYDFGAKTSIFKKLQHSGFEVHIFPATTPAKELLAISPDAVFLSKRPRRSRRPRLRAQECERADRHG